MTTDPRPRPRAPLVTLDDPGRTTAEQWRSRLGESRWPAVRGRAARILVVSAHPDDEVLGAGGLISDSVAAGAHVTVLCLSDGGASHPGSPTMSPRQLVDARHVELTTALSALGVSCVVRRRLPDGYLQDCIGAVERAIAHSVAACGGHDLIVSVWESDRHPDHEAVGRAAAAVADRTGLPLLSYPVWMWHWAGLDDPDVPWSSARTHDLSPAAQRAKLRAVHAFTTQITDLSAHPADRAVLPRHVLDRLTGPTEMFFA